MPEEQYNFGLRDTPHDPNDFSLGAVYDLPKLSDLPSEFDLGISTPRTQKDSDFCTAFASSLASSYQEGVDLEPSWIFAVAKKASGEDVDEFGLDLRTICKAHKNYGAIEVAESPFSLENQSSSFLRRIENWPQGLLDKAVKHKKAAFFRVEGPYDSFDNIRSALYHFRNEKRAIMFGTIWSWPLSQVRMDDTTGQGGGHALAVVGWKTLAGQPYLIIQNSYGAGVGELGRHYFSRSVINDTMKRFGAFMFADLPTNETKESVIAKSKKYRYPGFFGYIQRYFLAFY